MEDLQYREVLKRVLFDLPRGMPVTARHLKEMEASPKLVSLYIEHGWLESLGDGYFLRVKDTLTATGAIASLQHNGVNVHIGGKSALALKGHLHYVRSEQTPLSLYGEDLPAWFKERFPFCLVTEDLFDEPSKEKLCLTLLNRKPHDPLVSSPERAVLELLSVDPERETMEEAELIMEGLFDLRVKEMRIIFTACNKPEIKKLFARKARKLGLPIASNIRSFYANPARIRPAF